MREFDESGLRLSKYQGELFEQSLIKTQCSSPIFLRRFMYSQTAERMDKEGFLFEAFSVSDAIEEIENEYGKSKYGKIKYAGEELYWMGYIYRYWAYTHEVSSKSVYRIIKPEELRKLYFPYHSLDPMQVVERIKESKGIMEQDYIQRGVEILKRIRSEKG
ncbi:MAG: antitoxin [Lachnospiraceae bacterium]|nr:antitoxin [Lachnospiraceae bacterium]